VPAVEHWISNHAIIKSKVKQILLVHQMMNHQMISVQYKFQPVGGQVSYFKDVVKSLLNYEKKVLTLMVNNSTNICFIDIDVIVDHHCLSFLLLC
jgi:alpha-galactosidase/6-phospho-beta-glucosidase family protein